MRKNILVVEDDDDIRELVSHTLEKEGFEVLPVISGEEAIRNAKAKLPDLIVLDLMLPGLDGLEVCKALNADSKTQHIPVVMLTAKTEDADIVLGLELGADDYITKPFSPRVLVARVRAVLRRKASEPRDAAETIRVDELVIDPAKHEVQVSGHPVQLTFTEFRVLHFLARHRGYVFSRYQIVDAVRGDEYVVSDRAVDVQIAGLRKKLGDYGGYIETVRGIGYRFKD